MRAVRLRTEYLRNPLGIDIPCPRFYWNCEGGRKQTAYRIIARNGDALLWDSGKVASSSMTHIRYEGETLKSRDRVEWSVILWDEEDREGDPAYAFFEMGLLESSDWKAKWITADRKVNPKKRYPVDCFRKSFQAEKIRSARLYVTACGLYEGMLNQVRIGNFVLAPGHTDYKKRIQYQTYDVTNLIKDGENILDFQLADGWYRGSCGAWGLRNQYGTETKLLAQLELTREDGKVTTILSDRSWSWSDDGPIRFADNKDGEIVDASLLPSWQGYARETRCKVFPTASNNVSVTEHEHLQPTLLKTPKGERILDFGQNIAGYLSFHMDAKKGEKICLRFGEMLDESGEFTQKNIQCSSKKKTTPLQEIRFSCKEGRNEYKTRFAIFGFRYVLVETELDINPQDFTAIAVYSDLETTAEFDCSNPLLNAFFQATLWSTKNNSADVPTDCPTRERHGWTGDSQLFCRTANYLMNYYPFTRKHLRDLTDWQRKDGAFPQIAPAGGVDFYMNSLNGSVGWADAGILIPYRIWKQYQDVSILEENYDAMRRYAEFMIRRCGKHTLLSQPLGLHGRDRRWAVNYGQSYGEWAEPADVFPNDWKNMILPHPEVSTAYTAFVMKHMAEIAGRLGRKADAKRYRRVHHLVKKSYQALRHTNQYSLDTDRQAMLVRPLYMKLLDETDTDYAKKRLIRVLENYGWRLGTGFLSTPLILYVLSQYDLQAAYRLLENEDMPGWLFMPKMGATTIWESWEGTQAQGGIASLDHYSKGACLEWVFSEMCGIQVAGENTFRLAPKPGGSFTYAEFFYQSLYGRIGVRWDRLEDGYRYEITVPENCRARLELAGKKAELIGSGHYVRIVKNGEE